MLPIYLVIFEQILCLVFLIVRCIISLITSLLVVLSTNTFSLHSRLSFPLCTILWVSLSAKVLIHLFFIGNEQLILTAVIRHLDHKNILHDPQSKSDIIQTATYLARQLRSGGVAPELGVAGDLCRHLRKTLEAVESGSVEELNLNESLQKFLEGCLLEVVRGVCPALFQYMLTFVNCMHVFVPSFLENCNCGALMPKAHTSVYIRFPHLC